jgi:2-polyprenyl-3-methyl-5-hydroxy-6-metoxy-1,4-benzoquinol methylase
VICGVCNSDLAAPIFQAPPPALTSLMTTLDVPTSVFLCPTCGHGQSADLPDLQKFYDTEYRISLGSDEHDQLYAMVDGKPVFRTEHQADLVLKMVDLRQGAAVLDYGAAKAATLRRVLDRRPDLHPHVFDVSRDYVAHWQSWIAEDRQATYELPQTWRGKFDLVTAHFVLEHVAAPSRMLGTIRDVLKQDGVLFLSVPDVIGNPGDLLVVDHLNHFSPYSLERALLDAGFGDIKVDRQCYAAGLVITARPKADRDAQTQDAAAAVVAAKEIATFWSRAGAHLDDAAASVAARKSAIYGAGFYGSFIVSRVGAVGNVICFVDRNPHLQGALHLGLPVVPPEALPADVDVVYAGVNPRAARSILENVSEWRGRPIRRLYLDGAA